MKKIALAITLTFILISTVSFSEIQNPTIYCNGKKVVNNTYEGGYFLPILVEFKFADKNYDYVIKEGKVKYFTFSENLIKEFEFNSNTFSSNYVSLGSFITITISKIEVWKDSKLVSTDTNTIVKTITHKSSYVMDIQEASTINSNSTGILLFNDKLFNAKDSFSFESENKLTVSSTSNKKEIMGFETIMVRGKRPVATNNYKGNNGDISSFNKSAQSGDFIWIKIKGKDDVLLFSKILLIK